uniref:Pre-rRNA-processing protein TSR1 homolog n=1 Tax=Heligmosomoides polygyrus TaxID=6339 RepID=A0A183FE23_HELPZ
MSTGHQPGLFKRPAKAHKTFKGKRSKGQIDQENRGIHGIHSVLTGRLSSVSSSIRSRKRLLSKGERHQQAAQLRANKRNAVIERRRGFDGVCSAPTLITVLSCEAGYSSQRLVGGISACDGTAVRTTGHNVAYLAVPRFKSRVGFLTPNPANIDDVLDCIKVSILESSPLRDSVEVSDVVCFLWPTEDDLSEECRLLFTIIKAHGLPTVVNVVPNLSQIPLGKKREDARKHALSLITEENLTTNKLFCCDTEAEQVLLLRHFIDMKKTKMLLQKRRPHVLVEKLEVADDDAGVCSILASGYLRGPAWNVNHLVHIQGWGDFQIGRILAHSDPHPLKRNESINNGDAAVKVLAVADESRCEPLQSEIVPDPMDAEQTWPDEFDNAEDTDRSAIAVVLNSAPSSYLLLRALVKKEAKVRKVPKGTSSYQAAWIVDDDEDSDESESNDDEEEENCEGMEVEMGAESDEECQNVEEPDDMMSKAGDDEDDEADDFEEVEKYRRERENAQFPDEVDTPLNDLARIRFQKYRGLKKEWDQSAPLVFYQLLPHEQRMSVLNFVIKKHPSCRVPVMSKQKLIFTVGFRKFEASPLFSQHSNGDKFKMERFLPTNASCVATVFAPITFPPASVLVFREGKAGKQELVATGSLLDINPDRIILKRIVLSGHPFKINKRSVVCRYMFFNREDIEWFKPVELYTPSGRRGHIKEALGTHGHMKCRFDQQLNAADSIMMSLYKRVFPKWTYNPRVC